MCFTLKDFTELGSEEAIKVSMYRLAKQEFVQRLKVGLYYYPEKSEMFAGDIPDWETIISLIQLFEADFNTPKLILSERDFNEVTKEKDEQDF
jgi:hypothetical protein